MELPFEGLSVADSGSQSQSEFYFVINRHAKLSQERFPPLPITGVNRPNAKDHDNYPFV